MSYLAKINEMEKQYRVRGSGEPGGGRGAMQLKKCVDVCVSVCIEV